MRTRPPITTTLAVAGAMALATLPLHDVFGDWSWALSVMGAAVGAAVLASLVETVRRNVPIAVLFLITAAGAILWAFAVPLRRTFWSAPGSRQSWSDLGDAIFDGWGALLEERFPLTDARSAETFATLLVWVLTAIAVHVAARRRTALATMVGAAAILWVSTAAALDRGLSPAVLGTGAGVTTLLAVSTLTRAQDQRFHFGRITSLMAVLALTAGVATLAGAGSTALDRSPIDPRSQRNSETVEVEIPDLLAEYSARRSTGNDAMTITTPSFPDALRLRLQVYDTHDGERWLPTTAFTELASFPPPEILPPGEVLSLNIELGDVDGPWVPLLDRLIEMSAEDLRFDDATQTALADPPLESYDLTGTIVSRDDLEGLDLLSGPSTEPLRELATGFPDNLRTEAEAAAGDARDTVAAIDALTARVRELDRDDTTAPGSSYGRLRDDLATAEASGAEQFASMHALMLRSLGIPSRLVVGYVATDPLVSSSDLHIWTEVPFEGVGWVPFDPVPAAADVEIETQDPPAAPPTTEPSDPALEARALPRELGPGEDPDEPEIDLGRTLTLRDAARYGVVALVLMFPLLIGVRLFRRRLRRNAGWGAEVRVMGAWAELVDRLRERRIPISGTTTIDDVVELAGGVHEALGREARALADLAKVALHGPNGSTTNEEEAAWNHLARSEDILRDTVGRRTVVARYLDPRVLRYRAPRPPDSREGGWRSQLMQPSPSS